MRILTSLFMLFLCGCISDKIEIQTINEWEGRYEDINKLESNIKTISLCKGESVWMMSNRTLYRILEEYRKNNTK